MLSFSKKGRKTCYCKFLNIYTEKDLGIFSVDILSNRCQQKKNPKMPNCSIVRHVTLNAANKVTLKLIY
jgi:hypothetical protein